MNDRLLKALSIAASAVLLAAAPGLAANHPERAWKVKRSEHFALHYYPGLENTAARILRSAEAHYDRLAAAFGVAKPSEAPIPIIITHDSFFNGEAEPMKDRITLDPGLANSSIVGTERFVAHELAHVMTFQALDKGNKLTQLNNLGGLPTWFLEGIAQYAAEYWYPSTDRMLRLATLEHALLTTSERANFRILGTYAGAAGYNEGFALCRYMFNTHGADKLAVLMGHLKSGKRSFNSAIEATFGKTLPAIESGWRASLQTAYAKQTKGLAAVAPDARKVVESVAESVNTVPKLSPDGKRLAYLSSAGQDRFLYLRGHLMGMLSLFEADADGKNPKRLAAPKGMLSDFSWSSDGRKIAYTAISQDANGNPTFDAFVLERATGKTTRLTHGENVQALAWRPGSVQVAVVTVADGQNTIRLIDSGKPSSRLTLLAGDADTQYRDLAWRPDGYALALSTYTVGKSQRLAVLDPASRKLTAITAPGPRENDLDPSWAPDGRSLVFSSDRGGMTNLYRLSLATRAVSPLTRVYRGAEAPSLSPDGKRVLYSSFKAKGAEIYALDLAKGALSAQGPLMARVASAFKAASAPLAPRREIPTSQEPPAPRAPGRAGLNGGQASAAPSLVAEEHTPIVLPAPGMPDFRLPQGGAPAPAVPLRDIDGAEPYRSTMTNDILVPQMASDERGQQIGLAANYSDILNQHQLGMDVRYGLFSQRFSYLFNYVNRMAPFTWQLSLFDQPQIALSPDIGESGRPISEGLYFQRRRGVGASALVPLGSGRNLISGVNFGSLSTLSPPYMGSYGQLREGALNTLSLAYGEQRLEPTIDADVNPTNGYRLMASYTLSDRMLGSGFNFSQYAISGERYFSIVPSLRHNLTWRFNGGLINGDAVLPFMVGGATGSNPIYTLRGYAVGAFTGNRVATTGLEYTMPLATNMDKSFGPLYFDRLYLSAFGDVGAAWNGGERALPAASAGLELKLRTVLMGSQLLTFRVGLAQRLGSSDLPGFYLTF